mgnify:CR=1 FL=1
MKKRIISAIVGLAIFVPVLIFSSTWVFIAAHLLLVLLATFEMLGCLGFRRNIPVSVTCYLYTAISVILTRVIDAPHYLMFSTLATLVFLVILMSFALFSKGKIQIDHIGEVFMMMFYIAITLSCLVLMRDLKNGAYVFIIVYLASWSTDMCAYFTGKAFGKHKLIPDVSPKKTVEGAIGGLIGSLISMLVYAVIIDIATDLQPRYLVFILSGIGLSLFSMVGDLFASLLKRKHGIKDYGFIIPGHGGVLDRFDSVLATAPLVVIIAMLFGFFK